VDGFLKVRSFGMSMPDRHTQRVQDVMTRDPLVVHGEDDAQPLLGLFEGQDFNAVPVVDPEGHLVGVVTKLSLLRLLRGGCATGTTEADSPPSLRVRDVMDTRKVWVEPAEGLDAVVRQMTRYHVRSVPVVERSGRRHRLVGMVSRGDLLRGVSRPPAPT
jgi:CBS domain-containing protein